MIDIGLADAVSDQLAAEKRIPPRERWVAGWARIAEAQRAMAAANAYF